MSKELRICTCHNCGFTWEEVFDPVCIEDLNEIYCRFCGNENPISHYKKGDNDE